MASLEVRNLHQGIEGRMVLRGITFKVGSGDILSVIGPSGSGKTTLFRCILGELILDRGAILMDDDDVTRLPIEKRGVGVVYQNYALFPHLTVAENIAYGLRARRMPSAEVKRRVTEMMELAQLTGKEERFPLQLSGGERQRVALARALAVKPRILLLDEAFTALDANTRSEVVQEVRSIIAKLGVTTLLITHDQEEAFLFARRVLVLNEGQVVTQGASEEVMVHPDAFIQSFVKMVLFTRSKVEEDTRGRLFVTIDGATRIPIALANVKPGDEVHVMVKKGPSTESIEVWPGAR